MIATLNGNELMVGAMRVASIKQTTKGYQWQAIFGGGGRFGRKFFPNALDAVRACAKSCGITVRQPASWESIVADVEQPDITPPRVTHLVACAIEAVAHNTLYGEDRILAWLADFLRTAQVVQDHNLYIHRGGHHVAICAGETRLVLITAPDAEV